MGQTGPNDAAAEELEPSRADATAASERDHSDRTSPNRKRFLY